MALPLRLWGWVWKRGWRRRIAIAGVAVIAVGILIGIWLMQTGVVVGAAGWVVVGVAFVWFLLASVKKALHGARNSVLAVVSASAVVFLAGFPLLVVMLSTASGGASAAFVALVRNHGSTSTAAQAGTVCAAAVPVLVVVLPEIVRRRLSWCDAPIGARETLPVWLATAAAFATWSYIFLLRFGGQALSGRQPFTTPQLAAIAVGVAGLLAPYYLFIARSCWKYGIAIVFDPGARGPLAESLGDIRHALFPGSAAAERRTERRAGPDRDGGSADRGDGAGVPGEFEGLRDRLRDFARARDWEACHSPRNLALALAGEVGELAAELQWIPDGEVAIHVQDPLARQRLADEAADVLIYLTRFADVCGINLLSAAQAKIERNEQRFPVRQHDQ